MNISTFDDFLQAARQQAEPQRLLFVFADAELPSDATDAQRTAFLAGHGGALVPVMCVDKTPDELTTFADFTEEAKQFGHKWRIVFVGAMSGVGGQTPSSEATEKAMQSLIESIKAGALGNLIPFDRHGVAVSLG